jgi:hypothetical protein
MTKTNDYLIRRIDHHHFHGWLVSVTRRGKRLQKYFSDSPDGRTAALRQAREFRDTLLATLPPPTRIKRTFVLNKTGIIGVTFARERTRRGTIVWRYSASWPTRGGKRAKASFSVARYGKAAARRMAIQARQDGLRREGMDASLIPPSTALWKPKPGR